MKYPWFIWVPRILLILLMAFMTLFSFDVFEGTRPLGEKLGGFVMHNIPVLVLLAFLLLTWKFPLIAGIAFGAAALMFTAWIAISFPKFLLVDLVAFALPMAVGSGLFIWAHFLARKKTPVEEKQPE